MADDARRKRAAALEEKKRRLEELKARRLNRPSVTAPKPGNLDEYIDGLLKTSTPAVVTPAPAAAPVPAAPVVEAKTEEKPSAPAAAPAVNVAAEPAPAPASTPVKKVETFTISTQTEEDDFPPPSEASDEDEEEKKKAEEEKKEEAKEEARMKNKQEETKPKILSSDEVESAIKSPPFTSFLNTASKKVERLLGAHVLEDLLVSADYAGESEEKVGPEAEDEPDEAVASKLVTTSVTYECGKWTATRDVTGLDWSPVHRELMLASYHMPSSSTSLSGSSAVAAVSPDDTPSASLIPRSGELQSDGLALVWSLAMPTRPEHIFTCGSPVLTARFHPTEHQLVVGGCHSGQLVVWDVRAGRLPVQRSSLATVASALKGHSHPICSMEVVEGGSGLVTAATDGRLNFWSLANLRDPAESLKVGANVSSLAVAPESNTVVCGDESGGMHTILASTGAATSQSSSSTRSGTSRRVVRKLEAGDDGADGHFGMVTGLATKVLPRHSSKGIAKGFLRGSSGLVLTTGVDWTTKLWAPAYTDKPLLSFLSHSYDYMCDAQWSPTHPSVFATASSNGSLGIWNLASSLDEPISGSEGIVVDKDSASAHGLNKLKWSSDGRRIVVASSDRLHVLGMSEDVWKPKGDEDARMMHNLTSRGFLDEEKV
uniref:Dynein intermediate chain n=1 Tax=Helicotheca tamesis TaxID=374047 RepID=A0A7S2H4K4_9STRA|mmetsp:Transcript_15127/g.20602  ORF Transcript_15127/g.20602 Transcript_15127/m.20602 type:complete len:657 (+) Transcript_15127:216-2186(+)|eukprot:CAMPEP_0185732494 /NCGR_PEP_ID=MMETSP1171-20130828/16418_1 /TAXON_ID=374046 /ORGANISM="Helicotheca tamensis, Strain CCMP826" /LENGTH=656 /DNA_ID=CAMNT_0028402001 /DNA_START=181 /DNA_END=2151 /DNA_ORIENTATION=+